MTYNRTTWNTGDTITADKLNNIESGILNHDKSYLIESYINGTSGYRVYSDGYCEQWGRFIINTTGKGTITFLKEFVDTSYTVFISKESSDASSWNVMLMSLDNRTTSHVGIQANLTGYTLGGPWKASGYLRQG